MTGVLHLTETKTRGNLRICKRFLLVMIVLIDLPFHPVFTFMLKGLYYILDQDQVQFGALLCYTEYYCPNTKHTKNSNKKEKVTYKSSITSYYFKATPCNVSGLAQMSLCCP